MKFKVNKNFRIEPDLWERFRSVADKHGYTASGALRVQIIKFLKEMEAAK
ncbi:MAG: hypothetical protein G8D91_00350 [gamma proteobacterium symbiont of Clathrolucina costata]